MKQEVKNTVMGYATLMGISAVSTLENRNTRTALYVVATASLMAGEGFKKSAGNTAIAFLGLFGKTMFDAIDITIAIGEREKAKEED